MSPLILPLVFPRFEFRPPFVIFHDDRSGQCVMMFIYNDQQQVPLLFRGDLSSFDDEHHRYAWVFEGPIKPGDKIRFTTSDREVLGKIRGDKIEFDTVEPLRSRPRPIPMVRK